MPIDKFYCPALSNGLVLRFLPSSIVAQHCCLHTTSYNLSYNDNILDNQEFIKQQQSKKWVKDCENCYKLEQFNNNSPRLGLLERFGAQNTGIVKLDLMYSNNCNLACRTCSPTLSSLWEKQLGKNFFQIIAEKDLHNKITNYLDFIDFSNVEDISFSGGETMLGSNYYKIVDYLAKKVNTKNCSITFQTNGTQPWLNKYRSLLEKFQLVKLNISVDGIGSRFEYLRWPACWEKWIKNVNNLITNAPHNAMFNFEETISIFNLYYLNESEEFFANNFKTNKYGDKCNFSRHLAAGTFGLSALSTEYVNALSNESKNLIPKKFVESELKIRKALLEIMHIDKLRGQDFTNYFPELGKFYHKELHKLQACSL